MTTALALLKLALRSCERGDADDAATMLRGALALLPSEVSTAPPTQTNASSNLARAVSISKLAELLDCTARHVRNLIRRKEIPSDAVIGRGRGTRIVVERALEALRLAKDGQCQQLPLDDIAREGAEYARRRAGLRLVSKSATDEVRTADRTAAAPVHEPDSTARKDKRT